MVSSSSSSGRKPPLKYLPAMLALAVSGSPAHAGDLGIANDSDTFTPYVSIGVHHDDNLLRLPDNLASTIAGGGSETWTRSLVGLKVDKRISLQRITADVAFSRNAFDRFSELNHNGQDGKFNWNWSAGSHFQGNVGVTYLREQTPFEDSHLLSSNLRTQRRAYGNAAWRIHPDWSLNAGYSKYDLSYDVALQRPAERTLDVAEFGLDYLSRAGNKVGILFAHHEGEYRFAPINSYSQDELKAKVEWQVSGKTNLQFLGGYVKRSYDINSARDSDGLSARFNGFWKATGKSALGLSAWRELGATEDLAANYAINKGISLTGMWDASAKLRLDAVMMSESRDYNGVAVVAGVPPSDRSDRYRKASAGIRYALLRNLSVRTSIYRETLRSNQPQASYRANGIHVTSRYEF